MEAKLREYRARRRREELIQSTKEKLEVTKEKIKSRVSSLVPKIFKNMDKRKDDEVLLIEDNEEVADSPPPAPIQFEEPEEEVEESESETEESIPESWRYFITKWTIYTVTWITLYIFFLKVGFGAVFFVVSLLIGICVNTRTRKKVKGEVSAYSVFNRNCEKIDGTLDAEQLQRQMLYGVAGIRL